MCDNHPNYIQPEEETEIIREKEMTIQEIRNWLEDDILMLSPYEKRRQQDEIS